MVSLDSYKNRPPLGFDELGGVCDQAFELTRSASDAVEYQAKYVGGLLGRGRGTVNSL